jgi:hypothetical protein
MKRVPQKGTRFLLNFKILYGTHKTTSPGKVQRPIREKEMAYKRF